MAYKINMIQLQYISQGNTPKEHLINIGEVCEAGCRWVQLRLNDVDLATYLETAIKCREICDQYSAIMIVRGSVSIAEASQADGVHLGLNDINTKEARAILGNNFIIGGTASTIQDCLKHIENGVDYIGLEEYQNIISELKNNDINVPIIAIGEIEENDIPQIFETGVNGVAVSEMLTNHEDLEKRIRDIKKIITVTES